MQNKRGQELSTNTIILIILGVLVLVILIAGFVMGWDKILPFLSKSNVKTIADGCSTACSTGDQFGYCGSVRTLNDGTNKYEDTCNGFATKEIYKGKNYGIDVCENSDIVCETAEPAE